MNRFDDETKQAFLELYDKVDAAGERLGNIDDAKEFYVEPRKQCEKIKFTSPGEYYGDPGPMGPWVNFQKPGGMI